MNMLRPTKTFRWPLAATMAMALVLSPVATAEEARSIPAGQRQLFLDDDAVARIENLKRTLHQPEKRGRYCQMLWMRS